MNMRREIIKPAPPALQNPPRLATALACAVAVGLAGATNLPPPPVSPVPVTNYEYDAEGNPTKVVVDPATRAYATRHAYDGLGRRSATTDAKNGVVRFGYDLVDHLTTVTDPRKLVTKYQPDGLGSVKQLVSPDTGTTTSTYDAAGNLKTRLSARNVLATYTYDALNRPTQVAYTRSDASTFTQSWVYDQTGPAFGYGVGRLTTANSLNVSTTLRYDELGRVTQTVQTTTQAKALTVGTTYDAAGHVTSVTYPSGRVVRYTWANGQLQAVGVASNAASAAQPLLDQISYTPFGAVQGWVWQLGTPRPHVRVYDTSGRLVRHSLGPLVRDISYDTADRISRFTHYTAATAQAAPAYDQSFGYDELDRLQTVTGANTSWTYAYDANGNRTASAAGVMARAYNVAATSNRLNSLTNPDRSIGYDSTGNTLSDAQAGASTSFTATYGIQGWLATMAKGTTAGVEFTYDAFARRIKRGMWTGSSSNPRTITVYAYDQDNHLLGEYNADGTTITEYVWLNDTPIGVIKPNGAGMLVYAVHTDHLDTPRMVLDAAGNVRWRWMGDPFGAMPAEEQPTAGQEALVQHLRFTGQEYDSFAGKHHNYFRVYDPSIGRYVQSDPIGLDGGINTYAYVGGNPLSYVDPEGLQQARPGRFPFIWPMNPRPRQEYPEFPPGEGPNAPSPQPLLPSWNSPEPAYPSTTTEVALPPAAAANSPAEYCPPTNAECDAEWLRARNVCFEWMNELGRPDISSSRRRQLMDLTGGDMGSCVRGQVSQACGGNRVDKPPKRGKRKFL